MDYEKCKEKVPQGADVVVKVSFGLAIGRYRLSLWEKEGGNGPWVISRPIGTGDSEDNQSDDFKLTVNWTGERLVYCSSMVTHPDPKGTVSSTLAVAYQGRDIGRSQLDGHLTAGGEIPIRNGLILEGK